MKKILLLSFLCIIMSSTSILAQEKEQNKNHDRNDILNSIEHTVSYFIQENMDMELPKELMNEMKNNSEYHSSKNTDKLLKAVKRNYLRQLFFKKNPSLKKPFKPKKNVNPCIDGDFEQGFNNYSATSNTLPTSIVSENASANPVSSVAWVQNGYDPMLKELTQTSPLDLDAVLLPQTAFGSEHAIRINQNKGYHNNTSDNAEEAALIKTFVAESGRITFVFATVFEESPAHVNFPNDHPFFTARVTNSSGATIAPLKTIKATTTSITGAPGFQLQELSVPAPNDGATIKYSLWAEMEIFINNPEQYINNSSNPITLTLTVRDCAQLYHAGYVYIDNISNCCNSCNMNPEFTENINECVVDFNGGNSGESCPDQTVEWSIDGQIVNTNEDFSYDFQESGTYAVSFSILGINDNGDECIETATKNITVNCSAPPPPPTCPKARCLDIIEVANCVDYQAWMNCNDPNIAYINWYYTISSSYYHVYAGSSGGNAAGQHAMPIYLPSPPPGIDSWDNYNLYVYADIVFEDGANCEEIFTYTTLSCDGNGGGTNFRLNVYPNPSKQNSQLKFEGIDHKDVEAIELFDFYGNNKMKLKPNSNTFKLPQLQSGIYIAKFHTSKGIKQKKIIIE